MVWAVQRFSFAFVELDLTLDPQVLTIPLGHDGVNPIVQAAMCFQIGGQLLQQGAHSSRLALAISFCAVLEGSFALSSNAFVRSQQRVARCSAAVSPLGDRSRRIFSTRAAALSARACTEATAVSTALAAAVSVNLAI